MKTEKGGLGVFCAMTIVTFLLGGCLNKEESGVPDVGAIGEPTQNGAPSISGTPQMAIMIGTSYYFRPSASDPEGDQLTFSVSGLPTWASFNAATGELSGQPTLGDVGVFANIAISVSDGVNSTSLDPFDVTVTQASLGSMTLSWVAPTENTDGSALSNLAGYHIYYGQSSGSYNNHVRIDNPSISTYVVDNLPQDTYFVVATAYNSSGIQSAYSAEVIKTVTSP